MDKFDAQPEIELVDFKSRVLCSDGKCIGVVGEDGFCKVCGLPSVQERSVGSTDNTSVYAKCKNCGFVMFDDDPNQAVEKNCLNCGKIVGQEPDHKLIKCEQCGKDFSRKAKECPKCGWKLMRGCQVCSASIPSSSLSCPECGDPEPFINEHFEVKATIGARPPSASLNIKKSIGASVNHITRCTFAIIVCFVVDFGIILIASVMLKWKSGRHPWAGIVTVVLLGVSGAIWRAMTKRGQAVT